MQVIYAGEPFPTSFHRAVFLVGPTPRHRDVASWRPEALPLVEAAGFDVVFVPEPRDGVWTSTYDAQIHWEHEGMALADVVLAWVPRDMATMPALTTNVEVGLWAQSGKLVIAAPEAAPAVRYLFALAERVGAPTAGTLPAAVAAATDLAGPGALRSGGERYVPARLWHTPAFQSWYTAQTRAGNTLEHARVEWSLRPDGFTPVFWVLHASVHVAAEGRVKDNEVVVGRPDLSVVAAMTTPSDPMAARVALVREFRTAAVTADGFVTELPGGSAHELKDPVTLAVDELAEETGLVVNPARLVPVAVRQLAGTLATHRAHLFAVALTDDEMDLLAADTQVRGVAEDTEQTTITVATLAELLTDARLDFSMLGMVLAAADRLRRP